MSRRAMLVERTFDVAVGLEAAWRALSDVERWPDWAPHIASARLTPPGPLRSDSSGAFRFRPFGRSAFTMKHLDAPRSWTWSGRALGVPIDYEHGFEAIAAESTRLVWTVTTTGRRGLRARTFAAVYGRLIDRAWPRFVEFASRASR